MMLDIDIFHLAVIRVEGKNKSDLFRPIRRYEKEDAEKIETLITEVRAEYALEKREMYEKNKLGNPDFEKIKKRVFSGQSNEWNEATVNFYSSVVSTYIYLDARKKKLSIPIEEIRLIRKRFYEPKLAQHS